MGLCTVRPATKALSAVNILEKIYKIVPKLMMKMLDNPSTAGGLPGRYII